MRLMLLRHAKAEKAVAGMRDRDRRLNARGREDAARIAAYMKRRGLVPDRVVVSAAQRTRETWEQMAPVFSTNPSVVFEDDLYEASPEAITAVIKEAHTASPLLLIGHNPGFHDTARLLLARQDAAPQLEDGLPTAGLVVIDFAGTHWRALEPGSGYLADFASPSRIAAQD
jgi:phosphohistidine phosphatase